MLPEETVKETADKTTLAQVITEVKAAAEGFDRDAALEQLLPCANFTYDNETDGLINEIIYALEAFDCDGALAQIIKLEESL